MDDAKQAQSPLVPPHARSLRDRAAGGRGASWLSERFGWLGWHKSYAVLTAVASVGAVMLLLLAWFGVALVFRRWFQFSLRSLLFLVVVVALPCSWLAVEMKKATKQQEAVEALIRLNCGFEYDYEVQFDPSSGLQIEEEWYPGKPDAMPSGPAWLRKCLGDDFFNSLYEVNCNGTPRC